MAADKDLNISKESQESLQHLSDLVHLFNHRNKNQHRRSIWWRQFSTFRHQLNSLCADISSLNEVPTTNLARTKKKANGARIISNTAKRLEFWQEIMVSKWQHAFSQLVADGRFSVLGLVLLAVLSEVCQIMGITASLEEMGQREVEKVLEEFGREEWGVDAAGTRSLEPAREDQGEIVKREAAREDQGEAIKRDFGDVQAVRDSAPVAVLTPKTGTKRSKESSTKKSTKKRKKGGDAIDELFNF